MQNGTRGSRGGGLVQVVSQGQETLRPGVEYMVAGSASPWLPSSAPPDKAIIANNITSGSVVVSSVGGAPISGVSRSTGRSFSGSDRVRIFAGQRAIFVFTNEGWLAQGAERIESTFSYNGTPLTGNTSNPLNAGGIFHYSGIVQGGGTWVNPANTAVLTSAASNMEAGTVANLTDRVSGGQDVYAGNAAGTWIGWLFPKPFRCTGFLFQTRSVTGYSRNFQFRVGNLVSLSGATNVSGLPVVQSFSSQTQISSPNTYYGPFLFDAPVFGNALIWQITGTDTLSTNRLLAQEVEAFGDYEV